MNGHGGGSVHLADLKGQAFVCTKSADEAKGGVIYPIL